MTTFRTYVAVGALLGLGAGLAFTALWALYTLTGV